jgi:hypothetical protein
MDPEGARLAATIAAPHPGHPARRAPMHPDWSPTTWLGHRVADWGIVVVFGLSSPIVADVARRHGIEIDGRWHLGTGPPVTPGSPGVLWFWLY